MSPESLYGSVDSVKGDIWSVGTQYTLLFGNIPKLMFLFRYNRPSDGWRCSSLPWTASGEGM